MKRNKEGVLEFDNEAEKNTYYTQRQKFVNNSDEENARVYTYEYLRKYGDFNMNNEDRFPTKKDSRGKMLNDIANTESSAAKAERRFGKTNAAPDDRDAIIKQQQALISKLIRGKK